MTNKLNRNKINIVFQSKADQPRTYLVTVVYDIFAPVTLTR